MAENVWEGVVPPLSCYIARTRNNSDLIACSSGGAITAFARAIVNYGGVVCGAEYGEQGVVHTFSESADGIARYRGSKYVQSTIADSYIRVIEYLKSGKTTLFIGTPCQCAGLLSFAKHSHVDECVLARLYTIDFVCHGVGSPRAFRQYVEEKKASGLVPREINMRSKYFGYRSACMEIIDQSGRPRYLTMKMDEYLDAFFSGLILRPSCYSCHFKSAHHRSDLTVWDSWHAEKTLGIKADNKGYSNVAVQSEKGEELLSIAKQRLILYKVDFAEIRPRNGGMMLHSAPRREERDDFFKTMNAQGLAAAIEKFLPKTKIDIIIDYLKRVLHAVGLLDLVVRARNARK